MSSQYEYSLRYFPHVLIYVRSIHRDARQKKMSKYVSHLAIIVQTKRTDIAGALKIPEFSYYDAANMLVKSKHAQMSSALTSGLRMRITTISQH